MKNGEGFFNCFDRLRFSNTSISHFHEQLSEAKKTACIQTHHLHTGG